jgi:hypothetical protein
MIVDRLVVRLPAAPLTRRTIRWTPITACCGASSTRAWPRTTGPEPGRSRCSATRCASTCPRASPGHHEAAASPLDHPRAALVPGGRHQRRRPAGQRRDDLGRVGGRARRSRPGLRPAMALLGQARRRQRRPDRVAARRDPAQPRFPPPDRLGLEPGRPRPDGARPLPLPVPVLRERRAPLLPALPALRRRFPGRAVQHRELRAPDPHDRPGDGARGRRLRAHVRRLEQTRTLLDRAPRPLPRLALNPEVRDLFAFRYEDITIAGYDPHPAISAPVAV